MRKISLILEIRENIFQLGTKKSMYLLSAKMNSREILNPRNLRRLRYISKYYTLTKFIYFETRGLHAGPAFYNSWPVS